MKRIFLLAACIVLLNGCVSYTEDIDPSYENTAYLRNPELTCDDLAGIAQNLSNQLDQLRRAQDRGAKSDRLNILFLGALAWRNLLTEDNEEEIANLKGQTEVLQDVLNQKQCGTGRQDDSYA